MSSRMFLSRLLSRGSLATSSGTSGSSVPAAATFSSHHGNGNSGGANNNNHHRMGVLAAASAGVAAAVAYGLHKHGETKNILTNGMVLKAEVAQEEQDVLDKENRIRQYGTLEKIFDFFSSYQHVDPKGRKTTLMSVKDFYNSITPGSTLTHGTGRGVYVRVEDTDIGSQQLYDQEKVPVRDSILNKIQRNGLLTFVDFAFLLNILSTPRRYMDIAFHAFDVSADGNCEAKEFAHVMAKVADYKGDPEDLLTDGKSGLVSYIFGRDRTRVMTREEFIRIQRDLISDVLYLEFRRYTKEKSDRQSIDEIDFCRHLLYNAHIPSKKKNKMLKRVDKKFKDTDGVSFQDFKNFYYVLFGGADLERAMFFLDQEKKGVTKDEFHHIARWVANRDISKHVIEVIFTLLDEDGDEHLSIQEFQPVLFQWRHSRGFQRASLHVSLGHLRI